MALEAAIQGRCSWSTPADCPPDHGHAYGPYHQARRDDLYVISAFDETAKDEDQRAEAGKKQDDPDHHHDRRQATAARRR